MLSNCLQDVWLVITCSFFHCLLCDLVFLRENYVISRQGPLALTDLLQTWCYLMPDCCVFLSAPVYQLCAPDCMLFCVCGHGFALSTVTRVLQHAHLSALFHLQGVCRRLVKQFLLQLYNTIYLTGWLRRFGISFSMSASLFEMCTGCLVSGWVTS